MQRAKKQQRGGVIRLRNSPITYDDLKRVESSEPRRTDAPKALTRSAIKIANKVFQHRTLPSDDHVRYLAGELKRTGKPFKPVLVTAIGQEFYLVEGHHRLEAYHSAKWRGLIPVEVFTGTLSAARDEAFTRNRDNKLPMTTEEKVEAAWQRFLDHELSNAALSDRYGVHRNTIGKMPGVEQALRKDNVNPAEVRWRDARKRGGNADEPFDFPTFARKAAAELAGDLRKVSRFFKNPEITAMAIAMVSPEGAQALAEHLRDDGQEALEAWEELHGEEAPEALDVDIATAVTLVTGQLLADGQGELAQQVAAALRKAVEEHEGSFRL